MRAHRFSALLLLSVALPACSHTAPQSAENAAPSPTVLRVDNRSSYGYEIIMVRETGDSVHLGGVGSGRTAHLAIPSGMVMGSTMARFVARSGGPGAGFSKAANTILELSQDLPVTAGDTVRMSIVH